MPQTRASDLITPADERSMRFPVLSSQLRHRLGCVWALGLSVAPAMAGLDPVNVGVVSTAPEAHGVLGGPPPTPP